MRPVEIEIVTRVMTTIGHCSRCALVFGQSGVEQAANEQAAGEYPPEMVEEALRLSHLIGHLKGLYRHRLAVRLVDAHSLQGIYKCLRYRFRTYPAFIVEGRDVYVGWDRERIEDLIGRHVRANR